MPAIQLFLFKLKYFPTVWAVKIKSASAAYKCLVSPPRESPPSALGPGRSAHPARTRLESAARCGRWLPGCPSHAPAARIPGQPQGHLGAEEREPVPIGLEERTGFATPRLPPPLASWPAPEKSGGFPSDRVSGALFPGVVFALGAFTDPEFARGVQRSMVSVSR